MAVNLLLVGRTGNGKSSTGNSILGAKDFQPRMPRDSIIVEIPSVSDNGSTITVVDGPGIGDSSLDDKEGVKYTIKQVDKAISLCPDGFDAVIQVLKFGVRFTQQEKDSIKMMKSIFGEDIIKNHGIIIMTHGDQFTLDADDEYITFKDWCCNQVGDIMEIFKECKDRCVLFNNRAKDDKTLNKQRDDLLAIVKKLTYQNGKYTYKDFKEAESDRNKLLVYSNLTVLENENKIVMNNIFAHLQKLDVTSDHDSVLASISVLEEKFNRQIKVLDEQMKGVNIPKGIQLDLDLVRTKIDLIKRQAQAHREIRKQDKHYGQKSAHQHEDTSKEKNNNRTSKHKSEGKSQISRNKANRSTKRSETEISDRSTSEPPVTSPSRGQYVRVKEERRQNSTNHMGTDIVERSTSASYATSPRSDQGDSFNGHKKKTPKSANTDSTKYYDSSDNISPSISTVGQRYRHRPLDECCVLM